MGAVLIVLMGAAEERDPLLFCSSPLGLTARDLERDLERDLGSKVVVVLPPP